MSNLSDYSQVPRSAILAELARRKVAALEEQAGTDAFAFAQAIMRTERGEFLDFTERPYLAAILRDDRPDHVCIACAQSGKTLTYFSKVLQHLCYPGARSSRTAIYTFPRDSDAGEFASARVKVMMQASPSLAGLLSDLDNTQTKQLRNRSTLYFRGTWTDRAALSIPADLLVHDELDRSKPDTLQVYQDRTGASDDPRRYLFSTPTVPRYGIAAAWEASDQQEWLWSCPECGVEQCFAPMDRTRLWTEHIDLDAGVVRCAECEAPVPKSAINAGQWVAMAPENAGVAGYHITGIMPPGDRGARMKRLYGESLFPELFVQGQVGVPEVSGDKQITEDMVRFGDWDNILVRPEGETMLYAGVDQGKHLDFIAGDAHGRILAVHRFRDWSEVWSAMRTLRIRKLVGDSQPDPRELQKGVAAFPGRVLLADYSLNTAEAEPFEVVKHQPRVRIHRTAALDWTRDRIVMGKDGGDVFPALTGDARRELLAQLTSSVRTVEPDKHGNPVATWKEIGADHMRHAHVYYCVAARIATNMK